MTVMVDCMKIDRNSLNSRKNSGEIRNAALLKAASACGFINLKFPNQLFIGG